MAYNYPFRSTFLTQLMSVGMRSRESPDTLTKMLGFSQGMTAGVSLRGDDSLTLVDILDQASDAPNMESDLRKGSLRILQEVCASQTILPRACILSDNISKEGDVAFTTQGFWDIWKGRYNGNCVRIKVFRAFTAESLSQTKKRLFQEIVIWRRLSHPNVLPVLGVSPKLFPLCVITVWMINGNVMDFTSKHPEVNRLHLLAEVASGLQYLHSMGIVHGDLQPANILIDRDSRPRLVDYGFPPHIGVSLRTEVPMGKDDILAFGTVIYQVLTGQRSFPGVKRTIADDVITGTRPASRPPGPSKWLSDDVRNLISRCWSSSRNNRPNPDEVMDVLNDAGDAVELRSRGFEEAVLVSFLNDCKHGPRGDKDVKKAQGIIDMLDLTLDNGGLHKRQRKKCLKYLRKLCGTFATLPSSFILKATFDERGTEPFAIGGFSYVYEAFISGRPVVIKTLKVTTTPNLEKVHRLLVKEVVGWKWLRHENILPFIGVTLASPLFSIVSERMENGNIMEFIRAYPNHNRLRLLIGVVTGLEYLHENDIVHGDLKGVNILIDSEHRARLADFGLTVVVDETTDRSIAHNRGMGGTVRWMAPEVMYPERFGFSGECKKRLPSRSTDIYALGMTILEVITGCPPFDNLLVEPAIIYKVLEGGRPERPSSGFSDQLWELLVSTWCAEHGSQPSKRPPTSIILNRLNGDVHNWGGSIIPPPLVQRQQGSESTDKLSSRFGDDGSETTRMVSVVHPRPSFRFRPSQTCSKSSGSNIRPSQGSPKIVNKVVGFLGLRFFSRLLRFLVNPSSSG